MSVYIHIHISKNPEVKTPVTRFSIPFFPDKDTPEEVVDARNAIVTMARTVGVRLYKAKPVTRALAKARKAVRTRKAGSK